MSDSNPRSSLLDKIFLSLFILAIVALVFVGGAAAMYFKIPGSEKVSSAFEAVQAKAEQAKDEAAKYYVDLNSAFANPIIKSNEPGALKGYTLISTWSESTAHLIDMDGKVIHTWSMPFRSAWANPSHVETPVDDSKIFWERALLLPNGDLVATYLTMNDTPYGYGLVRLDKNSKVVWTYDFNTHHDIYIDHHNGEIYGLKQAFINTPIPGFEEFPSPLLADTIYILSPEGKELKTIPLIEAFRDTPYVDFMYHKGNWDFFHTNSIDKLEPEMADKFPMFKAGDILVSIRNINTVAVIDHVTNKVIWATKGPWKGQHGAHFTPSGGIMMFDNGGYGDKDYKTTLSRGIEFNPATMAITWSYAGTPGNRFRSDVIGRIQRLANSNTMITVGRESRIIEVTPDNQVVWDYALPKVLLMSDADNNNMLNDSDPEDDDDRKKPRKKTKQIPKKKAPVIVSAYRYSAEELPFLKDERPAQ